MTLAEYISELKRLKQLAVDRWGTLTTIERQIVDGSFEWLVDNLEIKKGKIQVNEDLPASMDNFVAAVVDIINSNQGFNTKLGSFLSDLQTIQKNNILFHATTNNFNIETAGLRMFKKLLLKKSLTNTRRTG
jgi:hypothetical protein